MPGFAAEHIPDRFREKAVWIQHGRRPYAPVDGPSGATRFDRSAGPVKSNVAELGFAGRCSMINAAIDDDPAADAAS